MPNDAKLGLITGLAMVVLIALLFFRKEAPAEVPAIVAQPAAKQPTAPAVIPQVELKLPPPIIDLPVEPGPAPMPVRDAAPELPAIPDLPPIPSGS